MNKTELPDKEHALAGRQNAMPITEAHAVLAASLLPPYAETSEQILFGMGCFWGAERLFWQLDGIITTAVGYAAGITPNPSYEEVCSGLTGHNEVTLIVYEPSILPIEQLLKQFWQGHDPTQGMRQGNDIGSQYRSGIYCSSRQQLELCQKSRQHYQSRLTLAGAGTITSEILTMPTFYYAEQYHQQYLAKNPNGYCGLGGLGIPYFSEQPND